MAVAIVFFGALWLAISPINDLDSFWHVEIGREILQRRTLDGLGRQWLGADAPAWRTSQWLSEVGMYLAVERFGWIALPVLRAVSVCVLFTILTLTLVRRRQPVVSFVVLLLLVAGLETLFQDRPATISLLFVALLAPACERLWSTGHAPAPLVVGLLSLLWAQLHGLWVLAPAAFALVAVGGLLDRRTAPAGQVRGALLCLAASLAGVVNPHGPASFLLPLQFRGATGALITEWLPTNFTMLMTVCWGLLLALVVLAWARAGQRVRATELLWMLAWTAFGLAALRNVGVALLVTAPVAQRALEAGPGARLDRLPSRVSVREGRVLAGLLAVVLAVGTLAALQDLRSVRPLDRSPAVAIAQRLATVPGEVRLWDAWNASGVLVAFAGGATGHVKLAVDGRADMWGNDAIRRNIETQSLMGDWRRWFAEFRPEAAVLPSDAPLTDFLLHEGGWRLVLSEKNYVLLAPPGSTRF